MKDKAASYAALEGLTSVHLDFIRYNDAVLGRRLQQYKFKIQQGTYRAEYDFGYHPAAIEKFKKQFGYSPLDLQAPWMSPEWLQFRLNEVSSLVNEIAGETHAKGKLLSAAVFPYPTRARMTVYQDWPTWKLDIVCPMNYQSFYSEGLDWYRLVLRTAYARLSIKINMFPVCLYPILQWKSCIRRLNYPLRQEPMGFNSLMPGLY